MATKPKDQEIELREDGEERFLAAVHAAAKSGPKHREKPTRPKSVVEKVEQR